MPPEFANELLRIAFNKVFAPERHSMVIKGCHQKSFSGSKLCNETIV